MRQIKEFSDLYEWQRGHELVLAVYKATKSFPRGEIFGLTDQMRRAAISITSNIAEGFGRTSKQEKIHFLHIAAGSLAELKSQLLTARDLKYLPVNDFEILWSLSNETHSLMYGSIGRLGS